MADHMLSTVDNPFDPWGEYEAWYTWDLTMGYHTPGLLARIVRTSDDLSDADQSLAIERAIQEICRENVSGMHIAVAEGEGSRVSR